MNIYHISYTEKFVGDRMAMLSFKGCNFDCIGCIREKNEYDIYAEERRYIDWTFENILKELEELNPHRIYLGGYEPTLDPDLIRIIGNISKLDAHIVLMTNGSRIDERYAIELKEAGVNEVIVGVKAFDRKKHLYVVSYHPLYSEIKEIRETSRKVKFIEILPEEKKGEQEQ